MQTIFLTADNKPLMDQRFYTTLSSLLKKIGLPASHYNNGFRIGATTAKEAGISNMQYLYIYTDAREMAKLCIKLSAIYQDVIIQASQTDKNIG